MDGIVSEVAVGSGLEVTVQEQQEQGPVKHEKEEGEMTERRHAKSVRRVRAVYVHQKNVRATGKCVYTPSHTQQLLLRGCEPL